MRLEPTLRVLRGQPVALAASEASELLAASVPADDVLKMQAKIESMVSAALTRARQDAPADFDAAFNDVYTKLEA